MAARPKVVVIGAGTSGLAAAHTLLKRRDELDVTVLEAADRSGGRMGGDEVDGFSIDRAASLFLQSYATARRLAGDLGVALKESPHTKGGYVYSHGGFRQVYAGGTVRQRLATARTLLSFRLLSPRGLMQFARFFKQSRAQCAALDIDDLEKLLPLDRAESFQDYMDANGMGAYLRQWVTNDLRAYTGGGPDQSGVASSMALLWNFSLNPAERVSLPATGVGSFGTALAEACADRIRLSTPAERIVIEQGAVSGVLAEDGTRFPADAVVCCTPATVLSRIGRDLPAEVREVLGQVTYSACCKVVVALDFELLPASAYAAVFPRGSGTPLVALENTKAVAPAAVPAGKGLYHCLVTEDDARALFPLSDAEIAERVVGEIRRFFPRMPRSPRFVRVYRWHEGGCLVHGGLLTAVHRLRRETLPAEVPGLFLAGDYTHVPVTNGAMRSGVDAAGDCVSFLARRRA